MSCRSSGAGSGRAFELVRRSLLPRDEWPFADLLTAERLAEVFEAAGVDCSGDDDPDVVDTPEVTLWAFWSQMLFTGERGFCTQSIVVVTTLRDETAITPEDLADLFRQRWHAELDLRNIKSTMSLDVLRCKTPALVRTELWLGLLAYNLVRHSLLPAALATKCSPRQLSFCAALQFLANT